MVVARTPARHDESSAFRPRRSVLGLVRPANVNAPGLPGPHDYVLEKRKNEAPSTPSLAFSPPNKENEGEGRSVRSNVTSRSRAAAAKSAWRREIFSPTIRPAPVHKYPLKSSNQAADEAQMEYSPGTCAHSALIGTSDTLASGPLFVTIVSSS